MTTPVAVYLQDAHPIRQGMEIARYAELKGFHAVWQAESRLVREATVPMAAFLAATDRPPNSANSLASARQYPEGRKRSRLL